MIIAEKLKKGDKIKIIAPSRSLSILDQKTIKIAVDRLNSIGLNVLFSKNVKEIDEFHSSSIASRIEDLHNAFSDESVKGILTVIGGFNSNQLLNYIDYKLIKENPKIFCGFSDITALATAIYVKTGLVTYSGPHFSSFGMMKGFDFSLDYFCKSLMQNTEIELKPSKNWSNDQWWMDQDNRNFITNDGYQIINRGQTSVINGTIIGGNISTLGVLQGTEFFPHFPTNTILFIEECVEQTVPFLDRLLQSLIQQDSFCNVKAVLFGRFEKAQNITTVILRKIVETKKELDNLMIVSGLDFGHTTPTITFPIGGHCSININNDNLTIRIRDSES